jgi:hypothetical protein
MMPAVGAGIALLTVHVQPASSQSQPVAVVTKKVAASTRTDDTPLADEPPAPPSNEDAGMNGGDNGPSTKPKTLAASTTKPAPAPAPSPATDPSTTCSGQTRTDIESNYNSLVATETSQYQTQKATTTDQALLISLDTAHNAKLAQLQKQYKANLDAAGC